MVRGLVLLGFVGLISINANARTWPNPNFSRDPGADASHIYGNYKPVAGYADPEFTTALAISTPLSDQKFESYDVAVVINIKDSTDSVSGAAIKGQTIRVYARPEVLMAIGSEKFQNTNYDNTTGLLFYWKTSTARPGKVTPRGYYRPESFSSDHKSSIYNNAPMPWAVFFNGSIATHGVLGQAIGNLGGIASAGCARLEPQRGKDLFQLIGLAGKDWVDSIDTKGNLVYTTDGQIVQEMNYKTLISVL